MDRDQVFYGRHLLEEALKRGISIQSVSVQNADTEKWVRTLFDKTKGLRPPALRRENQTPGFLRDQNHQGLWFTCLHSFYGDFHSLQWASRERVLLLNHLEDPQNLGSLVRAAAAFGFNKIIHERERSVSVTPAVVRASAGLAFAVQFYKISNLKVAIDQLKKEDFWVAAADGSASRSLYDFKPASRQALVLGSEGSGVSASLMKACDDVLKIPMQGEIDSLNVAQAGAVIMSWMGRH